MKENYIEAEIEIVYLENGDIITSSPGDHQIED